LFSSTSCNISVHMARSRAYLQPMAGNGPEPGPLRVPAEQLPKMLGVTEVHAVHDAGRLALADSTLA
jgi:hypothetical protein